MIDAIFVMKLIDVAFSIVICAISDQFPVFYIKKDLFTISKTTALANCDFSKSINCDDCNIAIESLIDFLNYTYNTHSSIRS